VVGIISLIVLTTIAGCGSSSPEGVVASAAPAATPKSAPAATPKSAPAATPKSAPAATPKSAPAAMPESAPAAMPESTPVATPKDAPTATPKAAPVATPEAQPSAALKACTETKWGEICSAPPKIFYAADVPESVRQWMEQALVAATKEWGNYGPLEYWVAGVDKKASEELSEAYCARRAAQGHFPKDECLKHDHTARFLPDMAEKVAAALLEGRPFSSAGLNGHREFGFHLFSSSFPLGFAGELGVSPADDQKVVLHEYFHAVQHAHISTRDRNERDRKLGPVWFNEGSAEFMAQVTVDRLRSSGALRVANPDHPTAGGWGLLRDRMAWTMERVQRELQENPSLRFTEIRYGPEQNLAYDYGTWAHAWLAAKVGEAALLDTFYPKINAMSWDEVFLETYGLTPGEFEAEFGEFLQLPIEQQLEILPDVSGTDTVAGGST